MQKIGWLRSFINRAKQRSDLEPGDIIWYAEKCRRRPCDCDFLYIVESLADYGFYVEYKRYLPRDSQYSGCWVGESSNFVKATREKIKAYKENRLLLKLTGKG